MNANFTVTVEPSERKDQFHLTISRESDADEYRDLDIQKMRQRIRFALDDLLETLQEAKAGH